MIGAQLLLIAFGRWRVWWRCCCLPSAFLTLCCLSWSPHHGDRVCCWLLTHLFLHAFLFLSHYPVTRRCRQLQDRITQCLETAVTTYTDYPEVSGCRNNDAMSRLVVVWFSNGKSAVKFIQ